MINSEQIKEIISLYAKHGWILRRVLLSDNLREKISADLFRNASVCSAPIDALWFSRTVKNGESWEIRHLSQTPFALIEFFSAETSAETREKIMSEMETRLLNRTSKK